MKNLFCIISAIGNDYGVFPYRERFNQLLDSIESIEKYAPGSDIIVIDGSFQPLPIEDQIFVSQRVYKFIDLHNHHLIKFMGQPIELQRRAHALERKTLGEIILVLGLLDYLKSNNRQYDRIFKLAARFKLNQNFNKIPYSQYANKIVILKREQWSDEAYPLRLWSFDFNQLDQIKKLYDIILANTLINQVVVELIEKNMHKYTKMLKIPVQEIEGPIGVEGRMGADGILLTE